MDKEILARKLANWYQEDIDYLIEAIHNSHIQVPFTMGSSKALNKFKDMTR
tara:strand:- start:637 stop:789 length:153 start_codon:yes stop_codon:yes gene_type:complete